mgnify:CR=1 FL=1
MFPASCRFVSRWYDYVDAISSSSFLLLLLSNPNPNPKLSFSNFIIFINESSGTRILGSSYSTRSTVLIFRYILSRVDRSEFEPLPKPVSGPGIEKLAGCLLARYGIRW